MKEFFSMNKPFKKYLPIYMITLSIILLMGTSYALLRSSHQGENTYTMNVGTLQVTFVDSETNALTLENAYPMTDSEGISQSTIYKFSIENNGDTDNNYEINLLDMDISENQTRMSDSIIKYRLQKENEFDNVDLVSNLANASNDSKVLDTGTLLKGEKEIYTLQVWIDESADKSIAGQVFGKKIEIVATQIVK